MKIENGNIHNISPQQEALLKRVLNQVKSPETPQHSQPAAEAFNVDISVTATQTTQQQSSDEISHDRVAAIRDQLAAGTYNISGKDVAKKILGVLK